MHSPVKKNHLLNATIQVMLVAIILTWMAMARLATFHEHHLNISHESASGIEKQVAFYITEKKRMVAIFAMEHLQLIRTLANNPNDDAAHQQLGSLLTQHFPDRFAFTVANKTGQPLFEDFDGLVSELCLTDLKHFADNGKDYRPFIHPNSEGYHFDVMVTYGDGQVEGIFFVSFLADILGNVIDSIQPPDHQLMLVYPEHSQLIEISAAGARNHLDRMDYRLTDQEISRIFMRHSIAGTRWQVVDFHNTELHANYRNKLIIEALFLFTLFSSVATFMAFRLRKEEKQRVIAEQQKTALTSLITHEFRSPAATIKSATDMLLDGTVGEPIPESIKYLEMIQRSSSGLLLLVNDFLDIQQADLGNLSLTRSVESLYQVVKTAVEDNNAYGRNLNVTYHLSGPPGKDLVNCDKNRINQVLTNLLSNAAKYGGANDNVAVKVSSFERYIRVSITDHGPGISEDFQAKVFDKFSKGLNPKSESKIKSSGLGLSIAKAIVEQHGGSIGFDTKINKGTTFWFQLPTYTGAV